MIERRILGACASALLVTGSVAADSLLGGKLAGLEFNQDAKRARAMLNEHCANIRIVDIDAPNFPLAGRSEVHLICEGFSNGVVSLDTLALTFANDRLALLYTRGNAAALESLSSQELEDWMQFAVSWDQRLVIDLPEGQAWVMSEEAAHPNLFQWPNPYVDRDGRVGYATSAARPDALQFGEQLEELQPLFEDQCAYTHLATYDVWLLNQPEVQQQLDCFGFEYAGFPRKIEAVFGDGILQQAWILTGAGEEDRVREALVEAFGEAIYVDEDWEIYDEGSVMLRKDKPEVLMLSDTLAPLYRAEYIDNGD